MLHVLVGYLRGAGVDARWVVIEGDAEFFSITKRLHNRIHGFAGDTEPLSPSAARHYADVTRANAESLCGQVRPGDVVLLHDPQTLGMAPQLSDPRPRGVALAHRHGHGQRVDRRGVGHPPPRPRRRATPSSFRPG